MADPAGAGPIDQAVDGLLADAVTVKVLRHNNIDQHGVWESIADKPGRGEQGGIAGAWL